VKHQAEKVGGAGLEALIELQVVPEEADPGVAPENAPEVAPDVGQGVAPDAARGVADPGVGAGDLAADGPGAAAHAADAPKVDLAAAVTLKRRAIPPQPDLA